MGILINLTKEYFDDDIRREEGMIIKIEGEKYIIKNKTHPFINDICPIEDEKMYIKKELEYFEEPVYILSSYNGGDYIDYYFIKEGDLIYYRENERGVIGDKMKLMVSSEFSELDKTFRILDVLYETSLMKEWVDFDYEGVTIIDKNDHCEVKCDDYRKIKIYYDESVVDELAKESVKNLLEGDYPLSIPKNDVENFISSFGYSWIDENALEEWYEERKENYIENIETEYGEHGNRLFDEMIDEKIIEDTSEFFEIDLSDPTFEVEDYINELIKEISDNDGITEKEASEKVKDYDEDELISNMIEYGVVDKSEDYFNLDYTSPKFNIYDMKEKFKESTLERSVESMVDNFLFDFRSLDSSYCDFDKLSELEIEQEGREKWISLYDGKEYFCEIDDDEYFCYID